MDSSDPVDLESTASLLARVREGVPQARDQLVRRYLPILQRWARGRLPTPARDLVDTDDLVQVTLLRALDRVKEFEPRHEGAFLAYLLRILKNQIRDQARRVGRKPTTEEVTETITEPGASPLEQAIAKELFEDYEAAVARLSDRQQEAVMLRVELGFTYGQIAEATGHPSADAARMFVARALVRLAELMQ
jgi:RNA polymerase sigma-70 factor (ECF subfamily)